jgi:hypothetical protein
MKWQLPERRSLVCLQKTALRPEIAQGMIALEFLLDVVLEKNGVYLLGV